MAAVHVRAAGSVVTGAVVMVLGLSTCGIIVMLPMWLSVCMVVVVFGVRCCAVVVVVMMRCA